MASLYRLALLCCTILKVSSKGILVENEVQPQGDGYESTIETSGYEENRNIPDGDVDRKLHVRPAGGVYESNNDGQYAGDADHSAGGVRDGHDKNQNDYKDIYAYDEGQDVVPHRVDDDDLYDDPVSDYVPDDVRSGDYRQESKKTIPLHTGNHDTTDHKVQHHRAPDIQHQVHREAPYDRSHSHRAPVVDQHANNRHVHRSPDNGPTDHRSREHEESRKVHRARHGDPHEQLDDEYDHTVVEQDYRRRDGGYERRDYEHRDRGGYERRNYVERYERPDYYNDAPRRPDHYEGNFRRRDYYDRRREHYDDHSRRDHYDDYFQRRDHYDGDHLRRDHYDGHRRRDHYADEHRRHDHYGGDHGEQYEVLYGDDVINTPYPRVFYPNYKPVKSAPQRSKNRNRSGRKIIFWRNDPVLEPVPVFEEEDLVPVIENPRRPGSFFFFDFNKIIRF